MINSERETTSSSRTMRRPRDPPGHRLKLKYIFHSTSTIGEDEEGKCQEKKTDEDEKMITRAVKVERKRNDRYNTSQHRQELPEESERSGNTSMHTGYSTPISPPSTNRKITPFKSPTSVTEIVGNIQLDATVERSFDAPSIEAPDIEESGVIMSRDDLLCPISQQIMQDPVVLHPSGITYDRKHLCQILLVIPNRDPLTDQVFETKLHYSENKFVRRMLIRMYGGHAYKPYDDSEFQEKYDEAWDIAVGITSTKKVEDLYRELSSLLFGMGVSLIDANKALKLTVDHANDDAIIYGFRAMILDTRIRHIYSTQKNKMKSTSIWSKAEKLGLSLLAESGNPWAQWIEGARQYYRIRDWVEAASWYRKASAQGLIEAKHSLAMMYENGRGVDIDLDMSMELFREAAQQGHADAQCNIGFSYQRGIGVDLDNKIAASWYEKAARQNHTDAQCNLGYMHEHGYGVEKSMEKACRYYEQAAAKGHAIAQNNLGLMYLMGKGNAQDFVKAEYWLRKAAEQGRAKAQADLGWMYMKGLGAEKENSYKIALNWFTQAAMRGHEFAQEQMNAMLASDSETAEETNTETISQVSF